MNPSTAGIDRDIVQARQMRQLRGRQHAQRAISQASPSAPPAMPSSTLSSSNSRAIRPQPAPSAARIASSCCRPSARTSSRFATLAHAINSTMPTVPISTHSVLPTSPTRSSFSSRRFGPIRASSNIFALKPGGAGNRSSDHREHARDVRISLLERNARLQPGNRPAS